GGGGIRSQPQGRGGTPADRHDLAELLGARGRDLAGLPAAGARGGGDGGGGAGDRRRRGEDRAGRAAEPEQRRAAGSPGRGAHRQALPLQAGELSARMAERRERELMLGIFLMEAWDTAGALEEGVDQLTGTETPTAESLGTRVVLAPRLKVSAALYGFPGVSELAGAAERLLERVSASSRDERARAAGFLVGLVGLLKEVFDGISAVGVEDAARVGEFKARYP